MIEAEATEECSLASKLYSNKPVHPMHLKD